ncbi:hypothetical protein L218DRAFT_1005924 [Marasmius fiardii PR-910]|nr:hypothetical protein L218DRAFT_1005924 [Marasmius fiardii PR-910]
MSWRNPTRKHWLPGNSRSLFEEEYRTPSTTPASSNYPISGPFLRRSGNSATDVMYSPSGNISHGQSSRPSNMSAQTQSTPQSGVRFQSINTQDLMSQPATETIDQSQTTHKSTSVETETPQELSPRSQSNTPNEIFSEFYNQLRRNYVLQIARRTDLDRYSTTDIPLQQIVIENNEFYSPEFPLIRLSTFDLTPNDWRSVRDQYAEPFGPNDHIRGQARGFTRSSTQGGNVRIQPPGPSGSPGDDPDSNDPRRSRPHKDKGKGHNNSGRENSQPSGSGGGGPPGGPPGPPDGNGPPDSGSDFDIDRTNSDDESEDSISHPSQFKRSETPRSRLQPAIFGQTRFSSSPGDTFNEKERFVYNPTPLSDVEIL